MGHSTKIIFIIPVIDLSEIITRQGECFLALGSFNLAKVVANQVLEKHPRDTGALLVKGEAIFNCCEFEHALVTFYRGARLVKNSSGFKNGIRKCILTLKNIVDSSETFSFKGVSTFVHQMTESLKQDPESIEKYLNGNISEKNSRKQGIASNSSKEVFEKKEEKDKEKDQRLTRDKRYLRKLMNGALSKEGSSEGISLKVCR